MTPFRALRLAVIAFLILFVAVFPIGYFGDARLPIELREWMQSRVQASSFFQVGFAGLSLIGLIVGSVAILAHRRWGAWLHLFSAGAGMAFAMLMGPLVEPAASATIDSLMGITSGLIYGLAFFTDALGRSSENHQGETES